MKTTTPNGFSIELTGHGYGTRSLYVYSPIGMCVFRKVYEWHEYQLAQAEFDGLVALATMQVQVTVAA